MQISTNTSSKYVIQSLYNNTLVNKISSHLAIYYVPYILSVWMVHVKCQLSLSASRLSTQLKFSHLFPHMTFLLTA